MKSIFYLYFDLRKYAYIDRNYSITGQWELLSQMHRIIESGILPVKGKLYQLHLDTAVYYVPANEKKNISERLKSIKDSVDLFFADREIPSRLHISCVFGEFHSGEIILKNSRVFNVMGEVSNFLQQTICAAESEEGKILFEKICFHKSAAIEIGLENFSEKTAVMENDFYYL